MAVIVAVSKPVEAKCTNSINKNSIIRCVSQERSIPGTKADLQSTDQHNSSKDKDKEISNIWLYKSCEENS
jgi:hypothetical protein